MSKKAEKTVKNLKKPGKKSTISKSLEKKSEMSKNRLKPLKTSKKSSKMSKNAEKIVINVQKPGKNRQKYRKIVKNVEKH